jgi:hypothetical protein
VSIHPKVGVAEDESNPGIVRIAADPLFTQDYGVFGIGGNETPGEVLMDSGRSIGKRCFTVVENTFQLFPGLHDVSHVVVANADPKTGFSAPGPAQHGLREFLARALIVSLPKELRPFQQE